MSRAMCSVSRGSLPMGPSEPGTQGMPASRIAAIAESLSPISRIVLRARADEDEAALLDALGEVRVLGQEPVAGMNGDGVGHLRSAHHCRDVEVALGRRGGADAHRLVGEPHVFQVPVRHGGHGDSADPEFAARPQDPERDLSAIGDEYLGQHRFAVGIPSSRRRRHRSGMSGCFGSVRSDAAASRRRYRSRRAARRIPLDGRYRQ